MTAGDELRSWFSCDVPAGVEQLHEASPIIDGSRNTYPDDTGVESRGGLPGARALPYLGSRTSGSPSRTQPWRNSRSAGWVASISVFVSRTASPRVVPARSFG